jgi:hypothetical protein
MIQYRTMSPQDQATFRRWLRLNAVAGSVLAAGLIAMALVGSSAAPPAQDLVAAGMTQLATNALASGTLSQR